MPISEISNVSWFSRIKGAFVGILVGILMALVSIPVLFWNEGRAVHRAQTLAEGRGAVVENVPIDEVNPAMDGKLVHMSGMAESHETLSDKKFAISIDNAIKLKRVVEMYQWKENSKTRKKKKLGGGQRRVTEYTYEKVWSSRAIDSSRFNEAGRRENNASNPKMPFTSRDVQASHVDFGAFKLATDQVNLMNRFEKIQLEPLNSGDEGKDEDEGETAGGSWDERTPKSPKLHDNYYYYGDPGNASIGDVRVSFRVVRPGEVSLIYRQSGDTFEAFKMSKGSISLFENGRQSADQMFTAAETANEIMLWLIRLGGFALMALGIGLMLNPIAVIGDVVPVIGGIGRFAIFIVAILVSGVVSSTIIAIAWLFYRPLLAIALLAVAVGLVFLVRRFLIKRRGDVIEVNQPIVVG